MAPTGRSVPQNFKLSRKLDFYDPPTPLNPEMCFLTPPVCVLMVLGPKKPNLGLLLKPIKPFLPKTPK